MPDHDPFDKDFGFDEADDYWPGEPPKRKFSLRNHWLIWLLLINGISLFVILFLYSDGHPIEFVKETVGTIYAHHHEPTEEELLLEDAQRIKTAITFVQGEEVRYSAHQYAVDEMYTVYYQHEKIMNARGNSLIELASGYYYLSEDRRRLYRCFVEGRVRARPRNVEGSMVVYNPQEMSGVAQEQPDTGIKRGEVYQAPDGTWKNY